MGLSATFENHYYLTVMDGCVAHCLACLAQNSLNPAVRDEASLERAIARARSGFYQAVVFPPNFLDYPHRLLALELCLKNGLQPILQLHMGCFDFSQRERVEELLSQGCHLEIRFDDYSEIEQVHFWWLETRAKATTYTFVITRLRDAFAVLQNLPEFVYTKLALYSPPATIDPELFLTCDEVQALVWQVRERLPHLKLHPLGVEVWDPRLPINADLEPLAPVVFETRTRLVQIQCSVIVIAHQGGEWLPVVLSHLFKQKLNRDFFEVIVVDDGGSEETLERVRKMVQDLPHPPNIKYVAYPRHSEPLGELRHFRRGPARNLGAKHAQGEILVFLNANLLCPNHFLEDVIKQHRSWDVVQYQRFFLKDNLGDHGLEYAKVDLATDSQTSRGHYWEKFYLAGDWKSLPNYWKYTSFAGFSIKAPLFHQVGGCMKADLHSEFEGPTFGYKLSLIGARWKLRNLPLYELCEAVEATPGRDVDQEIKESAQLFYLNTLSDTIYQEYFELLGEYRKCRWLIQALGEWGVGRWLLRPFLALLSSRRPLRQGSVATSSPPLRASVAEQLFHKPRLNFIEDINAKPAAPTSPPTDVQNEL